MKKKIRMLMTSAKAIDLGLHPHSEKVLAPVEVELDDLSPCARWIAEHITATAIIDEVTDQCHILLESDFSRMELDRQEGVSEEELQRRWEFLGNSYTAPRASIPFNCALVLGRSITPVCVFEALALQAKGSGAARMICDGDSFDLRQLETVDTLISAGYADPACEGIGWKMWPADRQKRTLCVEVPCVGGRDPKTGEPLLMLDGSPYALHTVLHGEKGVPTLVWQHAGKEKRLPLKVLGDEDLMWRNTDAEK